MQTKVLELRPKRSLLNSDFDGYKLSLAHISNITEQLRIPVDRLVPDINQYSLLHAKLYALHNHLIGENEQSECVYFVDKELNIRKFFIDSELNQFSNVIVWKIPLTKERTHGDYNASLKFPTKQIAVVSDGIGNIYVLERGIGDNHHNLWRTLFCGDVAGPDQNFIICDAVYKENEKPELHLLLLSIQQKDDNERHVTVLHWITLLKTDTWNQTALRELEIKSFVQYARFEHTCEAIYVVSDSSCKFILDSENVINKLLEYATEKKYTWTQSQDDITLKFPLPQGAAKNMLNIKVENCHVEIIFAQGNLLTGLLYQQIDSDMTTWAIKNNMLEIILQKSEVGLIWPEVVQGDVSGEHIPDQAFVDEITERLAPLTSDTEVSPISGTTFNSQQVEECDFESDKSTTFERICCNSHNVTHKINLGCHKVLLTVDFDQCSALGVRSDVDICIWQPKIQLNNFEIEHTGTLLAMGYIQASKQQMKFFTCSPDLSYTVICESSKHIFLYCQNKRLSSSSELRNRTTGRRINTIAQQQVINLPSSDEILGVYASNSYLYILGETFIVAFKL